MAEKLLACPFCSGESMLDEELGCAGCDNCGIWTVNFVDRSLAVDCWNRRAKTAEDE